MLELKKKKRKYDDIHKKFMEKVVIVDQLIKELRSLSHEIDDDYLVDQLF